MCNLFLLLLGQFALICALVDVEALYSYMVFPDFLTTESLHGKSSDINVSALSYYPWKISNISSSLYSGTNIILSNFTNTTGIIDYVEWQYDFRSTSNLLSSMPSLSSYPITLNQKAHVLILCSNFGLSRHQYFSKIRHFIATYNENDYLVHMLSELTPPLNFLDIDRVQYTSYSELSLSDDFLKNIDLMIQFIRFDDSERQVRLDVLLQNPMFLKYKTIFDELQVFLGSFHIILYEDYGWNDSFYLSTVLKTAYLLTKRPFFIRMLNYRIMLVKPNISFPSDVLITDFVEVLSHRSTAIQIGSSPLLYLEPTVSPHLKNSISTRSNRQRVDTHIIGYIDSGDEFGYPGAFFRLVRYCIQAVKFLQNKTEVDQNGNIEYSNRNVRFAWIIMGVSDALDALLDMCSLTQDVCSYSTDELSSADFTDYVNCSQSKTSSLMSIIDVYIAGSTMLLPSFLAKYALRKDFNKCNVRYLADEDEVADMLLSVDVFVDPSPSHSSNTITYAIIRALQEKWYNDDIHRSSGLMPQLFSFSTNYANHVYSCMVCNVSSIASMGDEILRFIMNPRVNQASLCIFPSSLLPKSIDSILKSVVSGKLDFFSRKYEDVTLNDDVVVAVLDPLVVNVSFEDITYLFRRWTANAAVTSDTLPYCKSFEASRKPKNIVSIEIANDLLGLLNSEYLSVHRKLFGDIDEASVYSRFCEQSNFSNALDYLDVQIVTHLKNSVVVDSSSKDHLCVDDRGVVVVKREPRVLCVIFTIDTYAAEFESLLWSWGQHCDGFLGFSNSTSLYSLNGHFALQTIDIKVPGGESYNNMWRKTQAIMKYLHRMDWFSDFDYFVFGGDDLALNVRNLRNYLRTLGDTSDIPIYAGRKTYASYNFIYNSGGAGYVLNRKSITVLLRGIDAGICFQNDRVSVEDIMIGYCLAQYGIFPMETRKLSGGNSRARERFHWHRPYAEYLKQNEDSLYKLYSVSSQFGLDCCADDSISFHYIYYPQLMYCVCSSWH